MNGYIVRISRYSFFFLNVKLPTKKTKPKRFSVLYTKVFFQRLYITFISKNVPLRKTRNLNTSCDYIKYNYKIPVEKYMYKYTTRYEPILCLKTKFLFSLSQIVGMECKIWRVVFDWFRITAVFFKLNFKTHLCYRSIFLLLNIHGQQHQLVTKELAAN